VVVHGQTEAGANVTVDGTPVSVAPDGSFAATVPLVPGSNQITIRATDAAGNTATVKRTVVRTGAGFSLTGIPALDQNLGAILLLLLAIVVWAAIAGSRRARRRQLADKSGSLDQDLSAATAMRNDLRALEEFSPTSVHNPDFISMADFRRDTQEGREPTGRLEPTESRRKPR
jgi:hypothetical protein